MKLTKKEINEILEKYDLGTFKKFGKVMKDDGISFGRIIHTNKKTIFMKVFRSFDTSIKQGLFVSAKLYRKGFPTYQIYRSKDKRDYIIYKGNKISLIEYINIKETNSWPNLTIPQIKEFAKQLAIFHKLTNNMNLKNTFHGGHYRMKKLIEKAYKIKSRYNEDIRKAIIYMYKEMDKLQCKKGEKMAGYFSEFNPGHVIFDKNKVKYVIDWEIGHNYRFYDWGSSLEACFNEKTQEISFEKLKVFIKSYNSIQKLSKWEKEHIYEGLLFGTFKYGVWGLIDLEARGFAKNSKKVDMNNINKVLNIINLSKKEFYKKLK